MLIRFRLIDMNRLGKAYNGMSSYFWMCYSKWPVKRCRTCGKMEYPNGPEHIGQVEPDYPPYYICREHGESGKTYQDCFTGLDVEVGPEPNMFLKMMTDSMQEALFWTWVMVKYILFTIEDLLSHIFYWRKIRKSNMLWKRAMEEIGNE